MENDLKITQVTAHLITNTSEFDHISCNTYSPFLRIQLPDSLFWLEGFDKSFEVRRVYPIRTADALEAAFNEQINVIHEQLELF